jgi:hypothetical protein
MMRKFLLYTCLLVTITIQAQENFSSPIEIGELVGTYDCGQPHYTDSRNNGAYANDINYPSGDVFYRFSVSEESTVEMDMCIMTFDSYMYLYNESQTMIASNDDGIPCGGLGSYLSETVSAGTYFIICEGLGGSSGNYTLEVYISSSAPVPDVSPLPDVTGECSATVSATPTATTECEGSITGTTTDPLTYTEPGTYIVTWTYDAGDGNISTQGQSVFVEDNHNPVPDAVSLSQVYGQCSATVTETPTATDNCEGEITGTTTDPLFYDEQGLYSVTWTFDDGNGNTSTQIQTVLVADAMDPIPDIETLPDITGECSVSITDIPIAWDNCLGQISGTLTGQWAYSEQGTYMITWTYEDENGNTVEQTQNVIVDDVTAPVADNLTLPDLIGECSVTVSSSPTATDNCEGEIEGTTTDPQQYDEQGTYTITWTYDDGNGNTSEQTQTVIVADEIAPVADNLTLADETGECSVTVTETPTATDNCAGSVIGTTNDPLTDMETGSHTITWTYDDGNGNTSTQEQNVIVDAGTTPPVPDMETLAEVTGECSVTISTSPTATDDCAGSVTGTTTDPLTYTEQGTYTLTWTYDDGNGNTSTQTQSVVVEDVTPPSYTCNSDIVICDADVTDIAPADVDDNCTSVSVTYMLSGATEASGNDDASGESFNPGTTVVTYFFSDGNGNESECSFDVLYEVIDNSVSQDGVVLTANGEGTYQWFDCDLEQIISEETSQSFTPSESGSYAVIITGTSCTDTSACNTIQITGIQTEIESMGYSIYPNPTSGMLNIIFDNEVPETIIILNLIGKEVYHRTGQMDKSTEIDLSNLVPGVYSVKLSFKDQIRAAYIIKQ